MIPGFNHNIQYNGRTYHIQTEDSGSANPHIITLLYIDGTIIAKKRTSYKDILQVDRLQEVVRELMEEQHKSMLRELVKGSFDSLSVSVLKGSAPVPQSIEATASKEQIAQSVPAPVTQPGQSKASELSALFGAGSKDEGEKSLDEIILSYLADDNS